MDDKEIIKFINKNELDIRKRGALPRPFDQKVTPDVVMAVSQAILLLETKNFTNKEIINSKGLKLFIDDYFGKPTPDNIYTGNEYDKFVGQITNFYEYIGVLNKNGRKFSIANSAILSEMTTSFSKIAHLLAIIFKQILLKSEIWDSFYSYVKKINKPTNLDYLALRDSFTMFMVKNTNIKKTLEPRRIIGKVLNIIAYEFKGYGSKHGGASKTRIILRDLLYSSKDNSRDLQKKKHETREEFKVRTHMNKTSERQMFIMKKYMRDIYGNKSAVSDEEGVHVHHIFMASEFPQLKDVPENLIPLTIQEHLYKAHPKNNTKAVDRVYQRELLRIQKEKILEEPDKLDINVFNNMLEIAGIELP